MYLVYGDTGIRRVVLHGMNEVSSVAVGTIYTASTNSKLPPTTGGHSYAGENGIVDHSGNTLMYPVGRLGLNTLYMFDMVTRQWSDIDIYCKPVGVAFVGHVIVGFCDVISNQMPCVPYFKLQQTSNGRWTNVSRGNLCSHGLSTTNLTNPVILPYASQYGYLVKLYIAERETGILHEIDLGNQEAKHYNIPRLSDHELKVDQIIPAVAKDGSFTGIRIADSSPNSIYHILFSSTTQQFSQTSGQTETIAFDSYHLNYLVSFTANLRTMIVSYINGTTRQYTLLVTLDYPIQCENVVGLHNHYLVCLAESGLKPILINVASGSSQTIPNGDSPVAKLGTLNENTFYLLNTHQELSFYMITNSSSVHIGTYTVRSNSNFRLISFTSNITCDINHVTANETNSTDLNEDNNPDINNLGNISNESDITNQGNITNQGGDISNRSDINNQSKINNQGNNNNNNNERNNNNQTNINNQSDGHIVAICIGVVFVAFMSGIIIVYGLRKRLSSKQWLETRHKERILLEIPPSKSPSIGSIEIDIPVSENNSDKNRGESVAGFIATHDSPPCQRPLKDTSPGTGTIFICPSFVAIPNLESPPKVIRNQSSPASSQFIEADTVKSAILCSEKDSSKPPSPVSRLAPEGK